MKRNLVMATVCLASICLMTPNVYGASKIKSPLEENWKGTLGVCDYQPQGDLIDTAYEYDYTGGWGSVRLKGNIKNSTMLFNISIHIEGLQAGRTYEVIMANDEVDEFDNPDMTDWVTIEYVTAQASLVWDKASQAWINGPVIVDVNKNYSDFTPDELVHFTENFNKPNPACVLVEIVEPTGPGAYDRVTYVMTTSVHNGWSSGEDLK